MRKPQAMIFTGTPEERARSCAESENWPSARLPVTTGGTVAELGPPGANSTASPCSSGRTLVVSATMSPIWPLLISQSYFTTTWLPRAAVARHRAADAAPAAASENAPVARQVAPRDGPAMVACHGASPSSRSHALAIIESFVRSSPTGPPSRPGVDLPQVVVRIGGVAAAAFHG